MLLARTSPAIEASTIWKDVAAMRARNGQTVGSALRMRPKRRASAKLSVANEPPLLREHGPADRAIHSYKGIQAVSRRSLLVTTTLAISVFAVPMSRAQDVSVAQVKKQIIAECLAIYQQSRPCPCPYSGRRCFINAWLIPGGAKPFCYDDDVSEGDVVQYRSGYQKFLASRCSARP